MVRRPDLILDFGTEADPTCLEELLTHETFSNFRSHAGSGAILHD
jgi:hypothetical protein